MFPSHTPGQQFYGSTIYFGPISHPLFQPQTGKHAPRRRRTHGNTGRLPPRFVEQHPLCSDSYVDRT